MNWNTGSENCKLSSVCDKTRVIYDLKSDVKITHGKGTKDSPYILESHNISDLKAGNYVMYEDAKGDKQECVVLYGADDAKRGVQIMQLKLIPVISATTATNWNDIIYNIASSAESYKNSKYSNNARVVGAPTNFSKRLDDSKFTKWKNHNDDNLYNGGSWDNYYGDYYDDNTYSNHDDYVAMKDEKGTSEGSYIFCARQIRGSLGTAKENSYVDFFVGVIDNARKIRVQKGLPDDWDRFGSSGQEYTWSENGSQSLASICSSTRAIYDLKTNVRLTGGKGTKDNPYTLSIY